MQLEGVTGGHPPRVQNGETLGGSLYMRGSRV